MGSFLVFVMSLVTLSFLVTTPEAWVQPLGSPEKAGEILDGVVFLDAVADQVPGDATLTEDVVLWVDDDQRGAHHDRVLDH